MRLPETMFALGAVLCLWHPPATAQSPDSIVRVVKDAECPGVGGSPDIPALADRSTRSRILQSNGRLIVELGDKIAEARNAVQQLRARQQRSGIDSSRQISSTNAKIVEARDDLTVAMGFWVLARLYDYSALSDAIAENGNHPLADMSANLVSLDRAATQAGDPRTRELADKFRDCAAQAAQEYLDIAHGERLVDRANTIGEIDALSRRLLPSLGSAAEGQLRNHAIFRDLAARRIAIQRRAAPPAPARVAQADQCALATANARRNLPMVRNFLSALQRRQLAGTSYLASDAVMNGGGRSIRGRDRIISAMKQFGGSGSIGAPAVGQCGTITASFSGGRSGTIRIALSGNRIQTVNIQ